MNYENTEAYVNLGIADNSTGKVHRFNRGIAITSKSKLGKAILEKYKSHKTDLELWESNGEKGVKPTLSLNVVLTSIVMTDEVNNDDIDI